jgi:hypothetical protein
MVRNLAFCTIVGFAMPLVARSETWSLEAYVGDAYNLRTRLKISQEGGYSRSINADYETRGFEKPLYYVLRAARWQDSRAWEVSLIHHKLYLQNPPEAVSDLSISHGFNIVTLGRAARLGDWIYRFGAGPVITHAEATINGVRYDGPYRLAGAAVAIGGGRRFHLGKSVFVSAELIASAAYARPKLPGSPRAELRAANVALHGLAGIGVELR